MTDLAQHSGILLGQRDIAPFEIVNANSRHPVVLVCEHAGMAIPEALGDLGVEPDALRTHIGWDIGAADVARRMAENLGAPLILQNYSRLVIDCNRPTVAAESIRPVSDGIAIPGNQSLSDADRVARIEEIFAPFHRAVDMIIEIVPRRAVFAIHSFTPTLNGQDRPWDVGFLFRRDKTTSHRLAEALAATEPQLTIGYNEPYSVDDASDWFVPQHGEKRRLAHSLIEIRNDHLPDAPSQDRWAHLLGDCIETVLPEL